MQKFNRGNIDEFDQFSNYTIQNFPPIAVCMYKPNPIRQNFHHQNFALYGVMLNDLFNHAHLQVATVYLCI